MNEPTKPSPGNARAFEVAGLPTYCDFTCEHARFASEDAVGACRREVGVLCTILNAYVNKNARCQVRQQAGQGSSGTPS